MDAKLKADWMTALRSGDYPQTTGSFESCGKFCCLGVLCKVASEPTRVAEFSNWSFVNTAIGDDNIIGDLIVMNDDDGASFSEIADYIEREIA
jgi:hypothetical protein